MKTLEKFNAIELGKQEQREIYAGESTLHELGAKAHKAWCKLKEAVKDAVDKTEEAIIESAKMQDANPYMSPKY